MLKPRFHPLLVHPWLAFAEIDCSGEVRGDWLLQYFPPINDFFDYMMSEEWNWLWPWGWRRSDMQVIYMYVKYNFDEVKAAEALKTTKYTIRERLIRLGLTKEVFLEKLPKQKNRYYHTKIREVDKEYNKRKRFEKKKK